MGAAQIGEVGVALGVRAQDAQAWDGAGGLVLALGGVLLGLLIAAATASWRRRRTREPGEPAAQGVPSLSQALSPEVDTVLAALRAVPIVLDRDLAVVKAPGSATALGLVRAGRLALEDLDRLAEAARADSGVHQVELEVPRGRSAEQVLHLTARVAPLSEQHLLLLVEDSTAVKHVDEVRRDFVANVSHELKTPIGAITLLAEAIHDAAEDPEAVRRFSLRTEAEASRLARLVTEIIELSRLQYDDPVTSPEAVDVEEVVNDAMDRCRTDAEAKHIRLYAGGELDLRVLGSTGQLAQALGNLVENAVAYSAEHTRVAVGVRRREEMVEISVTDQGIGIAEAEMGRIFERFYRVDPARSRATGGTGLGLAIVKHVAAAHGGEVRVWSVEGAGSTFTLRLPLLPEPSELGTASALPPATGVADAGTVPTQPQEAAK